MRWILVFLSFSILSFAQSAPSRLIELTKTDLFASRGWNSSEVSVNGIHLGMNKAQASLVSKRVGFRMSNENEGPTGLCHKSRCDVFTLSHLFTGVTLEFDKSDRLISIEITRTPEDADPAIREVAITRKFVGGTNRFFSDYSDALRGRLLGTQDRSDPSSGTFEYRRAGLVVWVRPNPHGPERTSDLRVTFRTADER